MTNTRFAAPSGVILVLRVETAELAHTAAVGAIAGGIDAVEITTSVPDAMDVVADLVRSHPGVPIGAGTLLTPADVDAAAAAGAQFLVSPDTHPEVLAAAAAHGLPMVPGALTPTEVQRAHSLGAAAVKIFPAGSVGGPTYIRELSGPLPHITYVASGGIDESTAPRYFAAGASAVCVGRNILNSEALSTGDMAAVTAHTASFMAAVRPGD